MKKLVNKTYFTLILGACTMMSNAQNLTDFESWNSLGIEYKINKKFRVGLQQHLRLDNNASEINQYFTQVYLDYKIIKGVTLSGGARYIRRNDNEGKIQGYENHLRLQADLGLRFSLATRAKLAARFRYQSKNELGLDIPTDSKDYMRLKTGISYNIRNWKLDPKLYGEIFYKLKSNDRFNKYRLGLGTSYKFNKSNKLSVTYIYERELNAIPVGSSNIIKLGYTFEI